MDWRKKERKRVEGRIRQGGEKKLGNEEKKRGKREVRTAKTSRKKNAAQ